MSGPAGLTTAPVVGAFVCVQDAFTALHCLEFLCYVNRLRNRGYEIKAMQHSAG